MSGLAACASTTAQKDKDRAQIHYDIAVAEMNKGSMRDALRELLRAKELDPELPQVHHVLGLVYHSLGRTDDALHHYEEALRLRPSFSEAHNNLGILLLDLGRYDDAIGHFKVALGDILYATPSLAEGNMGWAYYKKGDAQTGVRHLKNAVATSPQFCRGYEWLVRIGLETDATDQVVTACQRFDKFCVSDKAIRKSIAQTYLAELGYYCGLGYTKAQDSQAARMAFAVCANTSESSFAPRCARSLQDLGPAPQGTP